MGVVGWKIQGRLRGKKRMVGPAVRRKNNGFGGGGRRLSVEKMGEGEGLFCGGRRPFWVRVKEKKKNKGWRGCCIFFLVELSLGLGFFVVFSPLYKIAPP